jgi:hypothetical protein
MTIGTQISSITVDGNGVTPSFAYPFLMPSASDAVVIYTAVGGVQTVLANTQYAISGVGNPSGGLVVYPISGPPIPSGSEITIQRVLPMIQPASLSSQGPTFAAIEAEFDYATMLIQQMAGQVGRAIVINPADPLGVVPLPIASVRAGQALVFDSQGNATVGLPVGSATISAAMQPVVMAATIPDAVALLDVITQSGGTVTGSLGVDGWLTSNSLMVVQGVAGTQRLAGAATLIGGVASFRWAWGANAAAESGANAGSDFILERLSDAGAVIDAPIEINRATGVMTLSQSPLMPTPSVSDNSVRGATTAWVRAEFFKTAHDVTGSRAIGVVYTNSTGLPMFLSVFGQGGSGADFTLLINGSATASQFTTGSTNVSVYGMVPIGATYEVTETIGLTFGAWVETY